MLLGALATGSRGAIGSTFNIAAPLYHRIIAAFADGDLNEARRLQSLSVNMIRTLSRFPLPPRHEGRAGDAGRQRRRLPIAAEPFVERRCHGVAIRTRLDRIFRVVAIYCASTGSVNMDHVCGGFPELRMTP